MVKITNVSLLLMVVLNIHLIPSTNIHLFSPQAFIHQTKQCYVLLDITGCTLTLPFLRLLHPVCINDDPSNLPHTSLFSFADISPSLLSTTVADEINKNLTPSLKELFI